MASLGFSFFVYFSYRVAKTIYYQPQGSTSILDKLINWLTRGRTLNFNLNLANSCGGAFDMSPREFFGNEENSKK